MEASPRRSTRQSLKRSASQASLHSFPPTPPRTHRRRGRGRSRGSCDSDSDDGPLSDKDELPQVQDDKDAGIRKKRRLNVAKLDDGDEEARFWGAGESSNSKPPDTRPSTRSKKPLIYQRFKPQSTTSSISSEQLVSPPPSHRKPVVAPAAPAPATPSPAANLSLPVTPVRRSKRKAGGSVAGFPLLRDSPSNPFIATPIEEGDEVESPSGLTQGHESPTPAYDKPTVTFVFRGVKRVYQNPMYNHEKGRPVTPPPNSKLPVEDPNYSPDPSCKPRLLFPEAHKRRKGKKVAALPSTPSPRCNNDSDSEFEGPATRGRVKSPKFAKLTMTLAAELKQAEKKKTAQSSQANDDPFF